MLLWVLAAGALVRPWLLLWVLAAGALLLRLLLLWVLAAGAPSDCRLPAGGCELLTVPVDLLFPVETGALLTVPVDTLRLLLPCVAAGVDSLRRSVDTGLVSLLVCTEDDDLRLSPF